MLVLVCIGCSVVVSVITTKILAIHYFGIVNGYVDEICNMTRDFVRKTESMICRYQQKKRPRGVREHIPLLISTNLSEPGCSYFFFRFW